MSEISEIEFIVKSINEVLSTKYTLVEFDELQGNTLLQVLVNIFGTLQPQMAQLRIADDPENGPLAAYDFLTTILNYKVPPHQQAETQLSFSRGEKTTLYPIFFWVLKRMPENAKRVYLAQYLLPVQVPQDMVMQDEGVREVYEQYTQLREEFKVVHKTVEKLKETNGDATDMKKKVQALNAEREKLQKHINAAQAKLSNIPKHEQLLDSCRSLRVEHEESQRLHDKFDEISQMMQLSVKRRSELGARIADVERDIEEKDLDVIIRRLQDDVQCNRITAEEKLPQDIAEKNEQLVAIYNVLNDTVDIMALRHEDNELDGVVNNLQRRAKERMQGAEAENISIFKNQVQMVKTKRVAAMQELTHLKMELATVTDAITTKEGRIKSFRESKSLKAEDVQKFSNTLRTKQQTVKNMKSQLAEIKSEILVLQHTEDVLRGRHENLDGVVEKIEREKGIVGYRKTDEQLLNVAERKNQIDQKKGETLEELSRTVQQFVNEIRDRRNKLAPQVLEMRALRQRAAEVEADYLAKKEAFEYQESMLHQETNKLQVDVNQYEEELHVNESMFHRLQCQMSMLDSLKKRSEDEKEYKAGNKSLAGNAPSYSQLFVNTVEGLERKTRELRDRKKFIDEHHTNNLNQMEWFSSLKKLLEMKLKTAKQTQRTEALSLEQELAGMNVEGGVDMLVLQGN
eukprot:PhM_4_TR8823/c0_g1_i1/m.2403/K19677/IFT81; intraflagellar transport protein 81